MALHTFKGTCPGSVRDDSGTDLEFSGTSSVTTPHNTYHKQKRGKKKKNNNNNKNEAPVSN